MNLGTDIALIKMPKRLANNPAERISQGILRRF
jgi:hypothetical protein